MLPVEKSSYILKVQRMWDGAVVTNGRCYTEYDVRDLDSASDIKTLPEAQRTEITFLTQT